MVKGWRKVVRAEEFQPEFFGTEKFDALFRLLEGNAGAQVQRLVLRNFRLHKAVNHRDEDVLEVVEIGEKFLRDVHFSGGVRLVRAAGRNQPNGALRHVDDEAADAGDGASVPFLPAEPVVFAGAARVGEEIVRSFGELG